MYVVLSGVVEIYLRDTVIETVPQGGTFGEMALIDGSPRSATVIAKTESEVAVIDKRYSCSWSTKCLTSRSSSCTTW